MLTYLLCYSLKQLPINNSISYTITHYFHEPYIICYQIKYSTSIIIHPVTQLPSCEQHHNIQSYTCYTQISAIILFDPHISISEVFIRLSEEGVSLPYQYM